MRPIGLAVLLGFLSVFFGIRPIEAASSYHMVSWCSVASMARAVMPAGFRGDFDGDGDVDQKDFGLLQVCLTDPDMIQDNPDCLNARLDQDGDVDQDDFTLFWQCLSGPGRQPDPACSDPVPGGDPFVPAVWTDDQVEAARPATVPRAYWSDAHYNPSNPTGKVVGWDTASGTGAAGLNQKLSVWDGTSRTTIDFDAAFSPSPSSVYVTQFYTTPVGLFVEGRNGTDLVLSRIKSWSDSTLTRCTTNGGNFGVNLNWSGKGGGIHRSLVYVGPTTDWPDGVVLYFEYGGGPCRVMYSTDSGDTWSLLFTSTWAIRHFHGGKFIRPTAANGLTPPGRLYVFTGDHAYCCALLFCDDVDDLIANPGAWRTRWGLDGATANKLVPDPAYCMNDNLTGPDSSSSSQKFRVVDVAENGGDSLVWSPDGWEDTTGPLYRTNHLTKVTTRINGPNKVYGSGWNSIVRSDGTILWFTSSELGQGVGQPDQMEYMSARCYQVAADMTEFALLRSWRRYDDSGFLPNHAFEAFGRSFVAFGGAGEKRADTYNYGFPQNVRLINASYRGQPFFAGALDTTPAPPALTELLTGGIPESISYPWYVAGGYVWHTHEAAEEGTVGRVLVVQGSGVLNRAFIRMTGPAWQKKLLTLCCRMKLARQAERSRTYQTALLSFTAASANGVRQEFTTNGVADGDFDGVWKDYQFTTYSGESYVDFWCCNNYTGSYLPDAAEMYVTDIRVVEGIVPKPRTE